MKHAHTSNFNDHKSNVLELLTYKQTYTYTTPNSKTPYKNKNREKLGKTAKMHGNTISTKNNDNRINTAVVNNWRDFREVCLLSLLR